MKYMVITSKHHDGFALFDSKVTDWDVVDATPYGKDVLKPLAKACAKHGMKLGFYYSQAQDWNHPGGAAAGGHWDKAQDGDMDQYIRTIAVPQVKEILSNYGPVAVLWWDTPMDMTPARAEMLLPLIRLQPGIIINNRLGGGYGGDTETPEQHIPATGFKDRDWETCMTMNDTWGYKSYDNNWKSVETLLRNLVDIASKGGNFLLNVGPTDEGLIPPESVRILGEVGKWMAVNGDSIHGTTHSPWKRLPFDGRATVKGNTLYLHVFQWPDGGLKIAGLKDEVAAVKALDPSIRLGKHQCTREDEQIILSIPTPENPDPVDTVVAVSFTEPVQLDLAPMTIRQADDGSVALKASDATPQGNQIRYESDKDCLGFWSDQNDWASWNFKVAKPGTFDVEIALACERGVGGSEYVVAVADQQLKGNVEDTGSWTAFKTEMLGTLSIDKAGKYTLSIKAVSKPGMAVMNLRSIVLKPKP
jgi:alpha-L-fucosidase